MADQHNASLNRRSFVAGIGALGIAGACATAAHTSVAHAADADWDEEHEFVVLGAGGSLFASMAAHNLGHDVVVLEKRSVFGGTMFYSHGALWCPGNSIMDEESKAKESPEAAITYLENIDLGHTHSTDLIESFVHRAPSVMNYIIDEQKIPFTQAHYDYYDYEGANHSRTIYLLDANGEVTEAVNWQDSVAPVVEKSGLDIRLKTQATELVTDDAGAVVGVVATTEDGATIRIKADKGVLIATGSFDHNDRMTSRYLMPPVATIIPQECTGDGIEMGIKVGADHDHMMQDYGHAFFRGKDEPEGTAHTMWFVGCLLFPGTILVGRDGKRFLNESCSYDELSRELCNLNTNENGHPTYYSQNAVCIFDSRVVSDYGWPDNGDAKPAWVNEYQTLEELAQDMGVDADGLAEEVERYNGFCETGKDLDWRRGEGPYDSPAIDGQGYGMISDKIRDDLVNPSLAPVAEPPFYACIAQRGSLGTAGGLVVDKDARVLNVDGDPIPGLYAAGCAADALVNGYPGGGFPIFSSIARSFFAMEDALGLGIVKEQW